MQHKNKVSLIILIILLTFTIACGLSFDNKDDESEQLKLQLTQQSLQMTQAALSDSAGQQAPQQQDSSPSSDKDDDDDSGSDDNEGIKAEEEDDGIPCNDSHILYETVKDGTVFKPGEKFEKTWTLRNEGDCDWTTDYALKFIEGNQLGGASSVKVPSVIEPNEDITFKVNLTAPNTAGDYTGVWQLFAGDGEELGRYWVKITVGQPAPPPADFAVTSVSFSAPAQPIDLVCPDCFKVTAKITVSAAGTVKFRWEDCEGGVENGTVTFDAPGSKSVSHDVCVNTSDFHWADLYIDDPNNQWFNSQDFQVVCNP